MSAPTAWIHERLPALLEAREHARWRPTTVQPASFSSRCMAVVAAVDHWAHDPTDERLGRVACYLILMIHDLRPGGILQLSRMTPIPLDEFNDGRRPVDIWMVEPVVDAWREWRKHRSDHGKVCNLIEYSMARVLSCAQVFCPRLEYAVEEVATKMKQGPPLDGGCHPDT